MSPKNILPPTAVARNARELLSDGVHLVELQVQLVGADLRQARWRLITIAGCAIGTLVLTITLLPIAFACAALALWEFAGLSLAGSFAIVLGGGILLIVACLLVVWRMTRDSDLLFCESRREFARNIEWFKSTIRGHS
jgi:uncharacterized membrane protein YqjE